MNIFIRNMFLLFSFVIMGWMGTACNSKAPSSPTGGSLEFKFFDLPIPTPERLYLTGTVLDTIFDNPQYLSVTAPLLTLPGLTYIGSCGDHGNIMGYWVSDPVNIPVIPVGDYRFRFYANNANAFETDRLIVSVSDMDGVTIVEKIADGQNVSFGLTPSLYDWTVAGPSNPITLMDSSDRILVTAFAYKNGTGCGATGMVVDYNSVAFDSSLDAPLGGVPTVTPTVTVTPTP